MFDGVTEFLKSFLVLYNSSFSFLFSFIAFLYFVFSDINLFLYVFQPAVHCIKHVSNLTYCTLHLRFFYNSFIYVVGVSLMFSILSQVQVSIFMITDLRSPSVLLLISVLPTSLAMCMSLSCSFIWDKLLSYFV